MLFRKGRAQLDERMDLGRILSRNKVETKRLRIHTGGRPGDGPDHFHEVILRDGAGTVIAAVTPVPLEERLQRGVLADDHGTLFPQLRFFLFQIVVCHIYKDKLFPKNGYLCPLNQTLTT